MNVPRQTTGFRDKKKEGMKGDCIYELSSAWRYDGVEL